MMADDHRMAVGQPNGRVEADRGKVGREPFGRLPHVILEISIRGNGLDAQKREKTFQAGRKVGVESVQDRVQGKHKRPFEFRRHRMQQWRESEERPAQALWLEQPGGSSAHLPAERGQAGKKMPPWRRGRPRRLYSECGSPERGMRLPPQSGIGGGRALLRTRRSLADDRYLGPGTWRFKGNEYYKHVTKA